MKYIISSENRGSKFVDIQFEVKNIKSKKILVNLPLWRPGRYEMGNFAKNIQKFEVFGKKGKSLSFQKKSKSQWEIEVGTETSCSIKYNYYANKFDAGSTWVDKNQIYLNPVNCFLYVQGRDDEQAEVIVNCPSDYTIATGLKQKKNGNLVASSFDELADSPIIASENIKKESYTVGNTEFSLWFQGECKPNWRKLKKDFVAFTEVQLQMMGDFPFSEFHFFFQIAPYATYHGVEHLNSTVITLGPGFEIMDAPLYNELLGVSSHELFHAWNVKTIRPKEILPYDFSKENYTSLGYLAEGVTTYYGDLFLKRAKVFSENDLVEQFNKTLDRHFFNYGRFNKSVAESSLDTWLDGYERGIPNRKTSIYVEGCLLAFITDLLIRKHTKNSLSLDDFVVLLYNKYAKKGKGISEQIYLKELSKLAGPSFKSIFENYYYGTKDYKVLLNQLLPGIGYKLSESHNSKYLASTFGCYLSPNTTKVLFVAPDSPAHLLGINVGDEILSIKSIKVTGKSVEGWASYFKNNLKINLLKNGEVIQQKWVKSKENYFNKYALEKEDSISNVKQKAKDKWLWV